MARFSLKRLAIYLYIFSENSGTRRFTPFSLPATNPLAFARPILSASALCRTNRFSVVSKPNLSVDRYKTSMRGRLTSVVFVSRIMHNVFTTLHHSTDPQTHTCVVKIEGRKSNDTHITKYP